MYFCIYDQLDFLSTDIVAVRSESYVQMYKNVHFLLFIFFFTLYTSEDMLSAEVYTE